MLQYFTWTPLDRLNKKAIRTSELIQSATNLFVLALLEDRVEEIAEDYADVPGMAGWVSTLQHELLQKKCQLISLYTENLS